MTSTQKIRLSVPLGLFLVAVVAMAFFPGERSEAASPSPTLAPTVVGDPILEISEWTLTDYQAAATAGQGVLPGPEFRGVNIDGSLRAPSALGMHLAGNPFGSPASGTRSVGGVDLSSGAVTQHEVDLALPADGPTWVIGRSFNGRQNGGSTVSNGWQGKNWFQVAQPEIVLAEHGTLDAEDTLYLVYGADRFIEFKRTSASSSTYKATNGAAGAFVHYTNNSESSIRADTWVYTDQWSYEFHFFGFDADASAAEGQLWKIVAPSGEVAFAGDTDLQNDPLTLGYDSGKLATAYDSEDRRFTFSYTTLHSTARLTEVKIESKSGGTWSSPTGVENIGEVDYAYYSSETNGDPGDLKTVTISRPVNADGNRLVQEKYYRYWEGTYNATSNRGEPHSLRVIYDFEGVRRFDWAGDSNFDQDHLTASDGALEVYAMASFEYDASKAVTQASAGAGCGSCGGSSYGDSQFTYGTNGSFSGTSGYDTAWHSRTVVERADGSFVTQYFDEVGQTLGHVLTDGDPSTGSPDTWATAVTRNGDGVVTELGTPASVTSYSHGTGAIATSDAAGLMRFWTLATSGATKGFATEQKYNRDLDGSRYFEWSRTFATGALSAGATTVYRPVTQDTREYPTAITSGTSGSNLTQRSITWYSSTLMVSGVASTHPAVSTANNGSNATTSSKQAFDLVGRITWSEAEDGVINFTEYSGGQPTAMVRDADTSLTGVGDYFEADPIPVGWSSDTGAVQREGTRSYFLGFNTGATDGDELSPAQYRSVLADRRLVTLSYPHKAGSTFHGPVQFSVTNQAGRTEAAGQVSLSGNTTATATSTHVDEADSDPLLALDLGTPSRYRRTTFDSSGREAQEQWAYFDIPSSGVGIDGTHYDKVLLGYDSIGRQNRREEPHGTIYATTYDVRGQVTERGIGTNDSGTGSDNMVTTELLQYDGGSDGGNGHLTRRTMRTTSTSTGERVTDYTYDARGNRILTDAPEAPHTLTKYDNLGRVVASGMYKGTAPSSTADPESLATNRMALTSTNYDERGRVTQSYVYNIDPVDGSNDGSLRTDYWYDAAGRQIKVEGAQLVKSSYDRLGRQTHSFILATDNDARTYAAADDVAGDTVLVETQTVYASNGSDDVLMAATIERFHDDHTTSPTTGALDTNADADDLKYTAADIKGRIQITAMWYDQVGRVEDSVEYGTNGGATFDRDGLTVPARSATALRTTYDYDDDGSRFSVTDPKDIEDRWGFDDLGRQVWTARNYEDEVPESAEPDRDQIVRYAYTDGLRTTYTADLPTGSTDQVTTYYYGTDGGGATGDSDIATGHLLHQIAYPDSTGASDRMSYAYNAMSQEIYRKDQDGTVIDTSYDDAGRKAKEVASTLGTGINGDVRRKEFAYDGLGRMNTATQYDATTSGSVVDQVEHTHGEWGRMTAFALDVDSVVGAAGGIASYTTSIDYDLTWAGSAPTTRSGSRAVVPEDITMPTGHGYSFVQEATGYHREAGRTNSVTHRGTAVATFEFVGSRRVSSVTVEEFDFVMDYSGSSSGSYDDWDDFNRVTSDEWVVDPGGSNKTFLHRDYNLDEGGFITGIYDRIEKNGSGTYVMDTLVTLDDLNRITGLQRGTLSGAGETITNETMDQNRVLDLIGNVKSRTLDWNADDVYAGTDEYDESFTTNDVNEITDIDSNSLTWSGAGALTDDGDDRQFVYDAWGRMVQVKDGNGSVIGRYRRSAQDYLIGEQLDREPDGDVDSNDSWEYMVPRPSDGGLLASFDGSDADALVERLWLGDFATSPAGSFYSPGIIEKRDDDMDGTKDRTTVLFVDRTGSIYGNWGDGNGKQVERLFYGLDGVPYLLPWGDTDADADSDATDGGNVNIWWAFSIYDVRGDLDLDGDVDINDFAAHLTGIAGGMGELTSDRSSLGAQSLRRSQQLSLAVHRAALESVSRWSSRDQMEFVDGPNLYTINRNNSLRYTDRAGLCTKLWPVGPPFDYGDTGPGYVDFPLPPTGAGCQGTVGWASSSNTNSYLFAAPRQDQSQNGTCTQSTATPCTFSFNLVLNIEPIGSWPIDKDKEGSPFFDLWHEPGKYPHWDTDDSPGITLPPGPYGGYGTGTSQHSVDISTTVDCGDETMISLMVNGPPRGGRQATLRFTLFLSCSSCNSFTPRPWGPTTPVPPISGPTCIQRHTLESGSSLVPFNQ